jgi:hypothetical protein
VRQSPELESAKALHTLYLRHGAGIRRYVARMAGEACRTFRDERNELACEPVRPRTFRVVA